MAQRWFSSPRPDFVVLALAGGLAVVAGIAAIIRDLMRIPSLDGTAASRALESLDAVPGQSMVLGLDMIMFLAGVLLAAVGYAFQRGARLKHDTEGLV